MHQLKHVKKVKKFGGNHDRGHVIEEDTHNSDSHSQDLTTAAKKLFLT